MRFTETKVNGAFLIDLERRDDHRGFFARSWCASEYQNRGLNPLVAQINICFTAKKAGLRGLHYQLSPHDEAKTVRCTQGAIFDVVVDLRPVSPTYKKWDGYELTPAKHNLLYVPEGCAHGCLSLTEATEIEYLASTFYAPESARGIRFDDPAFGISWPLPIESISEADRSWPDFIG
jgi:dTDP-4-dehydrorhamnose 3,5-epimerase